LRLVAFIGVGSALGGITRYFVTGAIQSRIVTSFPLGTLLVNITGSILLGFLLRYALATPTISPDVRALLTTGFCGGYTTFSAYSYETVALLEDGDYRRAVLYMTVSVVLALAGTVVGFAGARELLALRESA